MSILTKVFVVLVTVVSCVLMAMVVAFAQTRENFDTRHNEITQEVATLTGQNTALRARIDFLSSNQQDALSGLQNEVNSLSTRLNEQQARNLELQNQLIAANSENRQMQVNLDRATSSAEQTAKLLESALQQNSDYQQQITEVKSRNVELVDRNNALVSENSILDRMVRRNAEEIQSLSEQLARAGSAGPSAGGRPTTPVAVEMITGSVSAVSESSGEVLVEVNVGSNDGIAPGMELLVHRGDEYLGTLVIGKVDVDAAAGRIKNPSRALGKIRSGDTVFTGNQ